MARERTTIPIAALLQDGVLAINDGYRAKNSELTTHGLPFARAQNINGGFNFEGADCFPEEDLAKVGNKISQPGDVVFTSKGTVGRLAFVREDTPRFVYAPQLCFWRVLDPKRLSARWLFYWMQSREFYVQYKGVAAQTDMAEYVSLNDQRHMHITVPPIAEQRAIAAVLGALDDKIELNRRMCRTLEGIARAIFQAWFVDFLPVRAKAAGAKSFRGMPQAAFDSLPTQFVDSPLGPIPKGWKCGPLPDFIDVNPARALRKGENAPYLDMANMPTRVHAPETWIQRPAGSGMRFINGDTLVARITPCLENGKTAYVDFLENGQVGWGSTEYIVLRPKPPLPSVFAYCLARSEEFRSYAIQRMTGSSGRQRVPAESLKHFTLGVPSEPVAQAFGNLADPLFVRSRVCMNQARALGALRDALLPKLVSDELRIRDVERIIGRCA